ncbi:hypothetical protein ASPBRDRAFT_31977 [Aspergillus brasiliensis CBS 101740]|uniref:Uncharacterized protein n=1 Tax=Aspergillus brasiliensis (strain CBS 101740 / IMI 381727 / IBT 21946) TaxID=767769 RepID=A0A1L9UEM9_ASPBC|nr:hypothetical protein ASPBRDRAFT_31977 [Aspergillus brasiliensis CBS 101740]
MRILTEPQIHYTYGMIIGTITVLEAPTPPECNSAHRGTRETIRTTNSLRATLQCLRTHCGRWYYMRGAFIFLLHDMIKTSILPVLFPIHSVTPWQEKLRSAIYAAILANLQILWVHIVLTKPSPKSFYQRLPTKIWNWIRVAPFLFIEVLACWLVFSTAVSLQAELLKAARIADIEQDMFEARGTHLEPKATRGLAISFVAIFPKLMEALVALPARAAFIRVAASMLPDDDEPLVSLDPKVRENASLGIRDAWNSFHVVSQARFWRVQATAFVMGVVVFILGRMLFVDFDRYAAFPVVWFNT